MSAASTMPPGGGLRISVTGPFPAADYSFMGATAPPAPRALIVPDTVVGCLYNAEQLLREAKRLERCGYCGFHIQESVGIVHDLYLLKLASDRHPSRETTRLVTRMAALAEKLGVLVLLARVASRLERLRTASG